MLNRFWYIFSLALPSCRHFCASFGTVRSVVRKFSKTHFALFYRHRCPQHFVRRANFCRNHRIKRRNSISTRCSVVAIRIAAGQLCNQLYFARIQLVYRAFQENLANRLTMFPPCPGNKSVRVGCSLFAARQSVVSMLPEPLLHRRTCLPNVAFTVRECQKIDITESIHSASPTYPIQQPAHFGFQKLFSRRSSIP